MMLPGALTGRLSCGHSETGQTDRQHLNLAGHALNGRFENPATPQSFRSLRFSNRPFSARANLIPTPDYHIYFLSEKDVLQSNKTAGGPKPHGGNTQGTPQSGGSHSRAETGITGW
ncbi:MAG: hypothetical protein WAO02_08685 [Verrucomicrobiia bacterium]